MKKHVEAVRCPMCEASIRHLQELVASSEGIDRACALGELGMAASVANRLDLALASFGACLDLLTPGEFPDLECQALVQEAEVLAEMDRYEEAIQGVLKAKAISERERDLEQMSFCEWQEGVYLAALGQKKKAYERIVAARDRYLKLDLIATAALCELDLEPAKSEPKPVRKSKESPRSRTRRPRRRT